MALAKHSNKQTVTLSSFIYKFMTYILILRVSIYFNYFLNEVLSSEVAEVGWSWDESNPGRYCQAPNKIIQERRSCLKNLSQHTSSYLQIQNQCFGTVNVIIQYDFEIMPFYQQCLRQRKKLFCKYQYAEFNTNVDID